MTTKTKKYKTVASYLRSHGTGITYKTVSLKGDEQEQRKVLNNLSPQIENLPMLGDDIGPLQGIEQLLAKGGSDRQIAALKDCQKWLKNFRTISITVHPQVKTVDGLVPYKVCGFKRSDHDVRVTVLIDAEEYGGNAFALAEAIAGPDYCFNSSGNLTDLVPDSAKNKLFFGDEELYAAVPEMRPPSARGRRTARQGV